MNRSPLNSIGFDRIFDIFGEFANAVPTSAAQTGYPPYSIKKLPDNKYVIGLAVAGFSMNELSVQQNKNTIFVAGNKVEDDSDYIHKGIAARSFTRKFAIADTVVVESVALDNGILEITLHNKLPEETITNFEIKTSTPQLLQETKQLDADPRARRSKPGTTSAGLYGNNGN